MRKRTPRGAAPPWRSGPSVAAVEAHLADGVPVDDLLELVDGAAELVASGRQDPRWWYPQNLFGDRTLPRWQADVAAMKADQEAARVADERREAEARAREAQAEADLAAAEAARRAAPVRDFELARIGRELLASGGFARASPRPDLPTQTRPIDESPTSARPEVVPLRAAGGG